MMNSSFHQRSVTFVIKKQLFFRLALLLAIILVSYLVFSKPSYPQSIPNLDKVGHIGSFFLLAWLGYLAFRPPWYWLTLELACYGTLIELVQSQLPYRSADIDDFIADMLGVALFYSARWSWRRITAKALGRQ